MTEVKTAETEIREIGERYYGGNPGTAFKHWALTCILADQDPDVEELRKHVSLGAQGNLEIDAYWIDELNSRIIIMKSRYSSDPEAFLARAMVHWFRVAAQKLHDEEHVTENGNKQLRTAYSELLEFILDDEYTLYLPVVTNLRVEPAAKAYADQDGGTPWNFVYDGQTHSKDVIMEILTIEDLEHVREDLLKPPPVEMDVLQIPGKLNSYVFIPALHINLSFRPGAVHVRLFPPCPGKQFGRDNVPPSILTGWPLFG